MPLDPSLSAGLIGAGIGGLGGLVTADKDEDRIKKMMTYAALLGPLAGAGHYAYTNRADLFPDLAGPKKPPPAAPPKAPADTGPLLSAGGKSKLLGYLAAPAVGAATGGAIRKRVANRRIGSAMKGRTVSPSAPQLKKWRKGGSMAGIGAALLTELLSR